IVLISSLSLLPFYFCLFTFLCLFTFAFSYLMSLIPTAEKNRIRFSYPNRILLPVSVCFILSGATGLIYEVLWARMLGLVFGATTFAVSTVLAAFMGGLALGSAWAGRVGPKIRRPLRAYGLLEIGVALY